MIVRNGEVACAATEITLEEAEATRTRRDELLPLFLDSISDYAMVLLDPQGRIVSWSRGAERLTGYTEAEMVGRHFACLYPLEEQGSGKPTRLLQQAQAVGRVEDKDWRVRQDGSRFWADVVITALYAPDGQVRGFGKVTRDLTEQKRAEDEARHREQQLAEVQRIGQLGSWEWDMTTNTLTWSEELCRIYGQNPQQFVGTYEAFLAAVHPDDRVRTRQIVEQAYQNRQPFDFEHRIVLPDGTVRTLHGWGKVVVDATGQPVGMMGTGQDITKREATDAELRWQQHLSAALLKAQSDLGEGLAIVDRQTQGFVYVNDALCQLYAYSAAELLALPSFLALVVPEDQTRFRTRLAQRQQEQPVENHYELAVCRKDGTQITIEVAVTQIPGPSGTQLVMLIRDITARKHAEEALRQAYAELEQQVQERTATLAETNVVLSSTLAEQQRTTASLQESEARFRLMADHAPVLIWMADSTGQCTFFNQSWLVFRGRTLDQEQRTGWLEGVHPEDQQPCVEVYLKAFHAQQPFETEYRLQRADGIYRWIWESALPRYTGDGTFAGYIGSCIDITERKHTVDALRAADVRLRSHIEHSPLAVIEWDRELRIAQWSPRAEQLFGWSAAEVLGKRRHEWQLVVAEDDAYIQTAIAPFLTGTPQQASNSWEVHANRNYTKDGRIIECEWYNSFLYDEAGRFTSILSLVHDVTARKQGEDAQRFLFEATPQLVSSLEYEKTLAQVAQLVVPFLADWCEVYSKDAEGQIRSLAIAHVDPAKEKWARGLQRRYPPPPDAPYGVPQALRTGQSELFSEIPDALLVDAARGDAELLHILRTVGLSSAMAVPLVARGRVLGAINFVAAESGRRYGREDLALAEELAHRAALAVDNAQLYWEAREAQEVLVHQAEALRRSNAELQQFAYVASHDLQEPLRMVTTYIQLLAKRYQGALDAKAQEFIGYAVEGATRMKALIDDLLDFSWVETRGKAFALLDCRKLVQRTLHDLQAVIRQREAIIEVEPLPTVLGDELQVGQVFQNLLSNALKFCTVTPQVRISAHQEGQQWVFIVQDNGIGIDPQQAERIFVLFQRLHTRQEYPGTGIGLAICKKIVERHGGRIWVESKPGGGATFYFTLDAAGRADSTLG